MKSIKTLYVVILVVIVGAGAFFGGMQFQKSQRPGFGQRGQLGLQLGRNGQSGRPVSGEIVSMDDKSITVKLMDGSSKIVILSSSTAINKQATGSASDLKTGERVLVVGTQNSDGSVTGQSILLNPMFRGAQQPTPSR